MPRLCKHTLQIAARSTQPLNLIRVHEGHRSHANVLGTYRRRIASVFQSGARVRSAMRRRLFIYDFRGSLVKTDRSISHTRTDTKYETRIA